MNSPDQNILRKIEEKAVRRLDAEAKTLILQLKKEKNPKQKKSTKKKSEGKQGIEKKNHVKPKKTEVQTLPTLEELQTQFRDTVQIILKSREYQMQVAQKMESRQKTSEDEVLEEDDVDDLLEAELLRLAGESPEDEDHVPTDLAQKLAYAVLLNVFEHHFERPMTEEESNAAYQRILMTESQDLID